MFCQSIIKVFWWWSEQIMNVDLNVWIWNDWWKQYKVCVNQWIHQPNSVNNTFHIYLSRQLDNLVNVWEACTFCKIIYLSHRLQMDVCKLHNKYHSFSFCVGLYCYTVLSNSPGDINLFSSWQMAWSPPFLKWQLWNFMLCFCNLAIIGITPAWWTRP